VGLACGAAAGGAAAAAVDGVVGAAAGEAATAVGTAGVPAVAGSTAVGGGVASAVAAGLVSVGSLPDSQLSASERQTTPSTSAETAWRVPAPPGADDDTLTTLNGRTLGR